MNSNQNPPTSPPPPPPPPAPRPACAACKHQRRRCSPHCPLAPYFPAHKRNDFQNVHKLFGLSYVAKLIETTPDNLKHDAVKSLVYEANLRAAYPVGGCSAAISDLQNRINCCLSELDLVLNLLAFCRAGFLQVNYADEINQEIKDVEMVKSLYGNLSRNGQD